VQPGLDPVFCLENRLWWISKEGLKPEVDRAPGTWRIQCAHWVAVVQEE